MKVIYVLSQFPKLSESFILNEIVELVKNDIDVLILSRTKPNEKIIHEEIKHYELLNRTYYFNLKDIMKANILIYSYYLFTHIINTMLNLEIPKKNSLKIAYFATLIRREKPSCIHTHFATMGSFVKELSNLSNIPYTITTHAYDIYVNSNIKNLKNVMENAELVVTISDYNKNYLKNTISIKNKIEVIRCGIDSKKFKPTDKSIHNKNKINILTVSRLVEKKGIKYLIESIPTVINEYPNCKFTIVGSGPLKNSLEQLSNVLNIDKYIDFKGDVSDSELQRDYNDADMFVIPCIVAKNGDRDGIPVSLMEAMAMEIPVISTNVSGIPELIEDGVSGILAPPEDNYAISKAIISLCDNEDLRTKMGINGRISVSEHYNIKKETPKLLNLFYEIKK